jgi:hypothetical protein
VYIISYNYQHAFDVWKTSSAAVLFYDETGTMTIIKHTLQVYILILRSTEQFVNVGTYKCYLNITATKSLDLS